MSNNQALTKTYAEVPARLQQGGPDSAGQSGDTQGLPSVAEAGSESVQELLQEGQFYEAEVLLGVETANAHGADEVQTTETPGDDIPPEYAGQDAGV